MISDARAEPTPPPIALAATADAGDRRFGLPTRTWWVLIRVLGGVAILGVLVWRVGADGFLAGLRMIDLGTLLLIFVIGAATTVLSAWRWVLVAAGSASRYPWAPRSPLTTGRSFSTPHCPAASSATCTEPYDTAGTCAISGSACAP